MVPSPASAPNALGTRGIGSGSSCRAIPQVDGTQTVSALGLAIVLRDQPWINPVVLFLSLIAGVIGSLVLDVIVVSRSRIPYVSDARLPGGRS